MSDLELEPASFRDPASTVAYLDGRVLRGLTKEGAADFDTLAAAPFFAKAMDEGKLVRTTQVPWRTCPRASAATPGCGRWSTSGSRSSATRTSGPSPCSGTPPWSTWTCCWPPSTPT